MKMSRIGGLAGHLWAGVFLLLPGGLLLPSAAFTRGDRGHEPSFISSREVSLLEGLYSADFPITSQSQKARAYFHQGLALTYGFDHSDAEISYLEATKHDPECAMAYWGAAFVLGPNINAPMNGAGVPRAYALARKALAEDAEKRFRRAWGRTNLELQRPVF